jgi:hypothetical protein
LHEAESRGESFLPAVCFFFFRWEAAVGNWNPVLQKYYPPLKLPEEQPVPAGTTWFRSSTVTALKKKKKTHRHPSDLCTVGKLENYVSILEFLGNCEKYVPKDLKALSNF